MVDVNLADILPLFAADKQMINMNLLQSIQQA